MSLKTIQDRLDDYSTMELVKIVKEDFQKYEEYFVRAAKKEIRKRIIRNFDNRNSRFKKKFKYWTVTDKEVFNATCANCNDTSYFFKINEKKLGYTIGQTLFSFFGYLYVDTFDELLIKLGIYKAGVYGLCGKCEEINIRCPYCETTNKISSTDIYCTNCNKLIRGPNRDGYSIDK